MTSESINLRSWTDDTLDDGDAASNRSHKIRDCVVGAAVVMAHGLGLYLAVTHTSVLLAPVEEKHAGSVQVNLVAAPVPQPAPQPVPQPMQKKEPEPPKPIPKPVPTPVVEKPKKLVLSSEAPSTRVVAEAPSEPQKVVEPPPTPSPPQPAPAPVQTAAAAAPAPAPSPNLLSAPKVLNPGELKQLGCQIPRPEYPAKAKRLQQEGTVVLTISIGSDGSVSSARVAKSSGFDSLDASALAAIRAGHCRPYTTAGVARSVEATQPIAFNLND